MNGAAQDPMTLLDRLGMQALQPLGAVRPGLSQRRLDDVVVRRVTAPGFRKPGGRGVNPDSVYWTTLAAGTVTAVGRGQRVVLSPELSTLRRGIGASNLLAPGPADIVSLEVPRERLTERGLDGEMVLLPMDELGRHARNYLTLLLGGETAAAPGVDRCLATAAVELLAGTVMAARGYRQDSSTVTGGLRLRAEAVIRDGCGQAGLCPQEVAERLHVSLRTLQRAYAEAGTTVSARIDHHRLLRMERLLSAGAFLTTDQLAARCGFRSAYQLRRAVRQAHGVSLREYRAMLVAVDGG